MPLSICRPPKAIGRPHSRADILKAVNHGIRAVAAHADKSVEPEILFGLCEGVKNFMKLITPRELMQVFPTTKTYDGKKWGTKDYFSTMDMIREYDIDAPIGARVEDFLWDYVTRTLSVFQVEHMSAASDLHRQVTGEDAMEAFLEEQGIKSYIKYTDEETGKDYLYDKETTEAFELKPPIPRYIKLVKGGE
jgi:hypothetical protein